jgi:dephospho-CoA kinase
LLLQHSANYFNQNCGTRNNMLLLGLTGSIATGKSTVSNILRNAPYNLPIIDADVIAREVVEPGRPAYNAIVAHFGPSTPNLLLPASECGGENGLHGKGRPLNRAVLGQRVFGGENDEQKKKDRMALNHIVHPAVRKAMYLAMLRQYLRGAWAIVLDIPLLFESGWEPLCGTIVVVAVRDPEVQMKRLRERNPELSAEDAENRVLSQKPVLEKVMQAEARGKGWGEVIWNDGSTEDLRKEVDRVMKEIRAQSPWWWSWFLLLCPPAGGTAALYSFIRSWWIKRRLEKDRIQNKAKL